MCAERELGFGCADFCLLNALSVRSATLYDVSCSLYDFMFALDK